MRRSVVTGELFAFTLRLPRGVSCGVPAVEDPLLPFPALWNDIPEGDLRPGMGEADAGVPESAGAAAAATSTSRASVSARRSAVAEEPIDAMSELILKCLRCRPPDGRAAWLPGGEDA